MIKKILSPVSLIIAVVLGGVGGDYLRNKTVYEANATTSTKANSAAYDKKKSDKEVDKKKDKKKDKKQKKDKKNKDKGKDGKDKEGSSSSAITYMKFKRQFVVPIMDKGKIHSLVILNINLELDKSAPQSAYTLEPKLRDAIMRELLALSHQGAFSDDLTSSATYDKLRASLLAASQEVLKKGVKNVLILDLMRQDQ